MNEKIRLRESRKKEKEEAYEAWKAEGPRDGCFSRFEYFGQGPLMRDKKTMMVYDVTEFLMRQTEEEDSRKGANTSD